MSVVNKLSNIRLDTASKANSTIPSVKFSENQAANTSAVVSGVNDFISQMKEAELQVDMQMGKIENSQVKAMFGLQRKMQSIHLTTEVITKSGEAIFSSARRIQQMGAN